VDCQQRAEADGFTIICKIDGDKCHLARGGDCYKLNKARTDILNKTGPYDNGNMPAPSIKHKHCNHHHELTTDHELIDFGDGEFVANKAAIPLLKALSELGLRTRTHHYDGGEHGFVSILLDEGVTVEFKTVDEIHADRNKYNGQKDMFISWRKK